MRPFFLKILNFDLNEYLKLKIQKIPSSYRKVFLLNCFWGFLCHGFLLTNFIINEDGHSHLSGGSYYTIKIGRWLLGYVTTLHENIPFPIILTSFAILLLSISSLLVSYLWRCKSKLTIFLISTLFIGFPALSSVYCYHWNTFSYTVSLFLSVVSVFFVMRQGLKNFFFAIFLLSLSLGIYQAFFALAASLSICTLLIKTLSHEDENPKEIWLLFCKVLMFGLASLILYKLTLSGMLWKTGHELSTYKGADKVTINLIVENLARGFANTLADFKRLFYPSYFLLPKFQRYMILLGLAASVLATLCIFFKKPKNKYPALVFLLLVIPCAFALRILVPTTNTGTLQSFGLAPLFCASCYIGLTYYKGLLRSILMLCFFFISLGFSYRNNALYLRGYFLTKSSFLLASDIMLKARSLEGFSKKTKLIVVGSFLNDSNPYFSPYLEAPFNEFSGGFSTTPVGVSDEDKSYKLSNIILHMGFKSNSGFISDLSTQAKNKVKAMPLYPRQGSIAMIDNMVVIKLSE
jgi:hypothetical protein